MLPYILWRPLYESGIDFYSYLRVSARLERRLRSSCAQADRCLRTAALSTLRLALFRG